MRSVLQRRFRAACRVALATAWLGWTCLAGAGAPAEEPRFSIKTWENDDGLPQNSVIAMIQTRDGYLWLGTLNGLARFDGQSFTVFDESNTPGLPSNPIVCLFEDRRGGLWIGTETAGAFVVREGRLTSLDLGRGSRDGRLVAASEDAAGNVWLYTADGQLARHREDQLEVWKVSVSQPGAYGMAWEGPDLLWLGTGRGLLGLDPALATPTRPPAIRHELGIPRLDRVLTSARGGCWRLGDGRIEWWVTNRLERRLGPYPWGNTPVAAAVEDREGNLVVGTLGAGVFWFDAGGRATQLSTNQQLSHNFVLSLHADADGNLWVGTDGGGLNRVSRQLFDTLPPTRDRVVQTVAEDAAGALWIGYNAGGVDRWLDGRVQSVGVAEGLVQAPVRAVLPEGGGAVWVGTWGAGVFRIENGRAGRVAGAVSPWVQALFQDHAGHVWAGTASGLARWDGRGWRVFGARDGLATEGVRAIAETADGSLWLGTAGGGLVRFRDGRFTAFRKSGDGLPGDDISALLAETDGGLWVGTAGSGLAWFRDGRWTRFSTREGLVSNSVAYLLDDGTGHLWIGSNAGLMRVPKAALWRFAAHELAFIPCRVYGKPDGMPTREGTRGSQPAACRTRDGRLWFPTIKGLASVDPGRLRANPRPPPDVFIERVLLDGEPQGGGGLRHQPLERVVIPAGRQRLEIQYTSVNLAAPDRVRFRHRLEDHETAWTDAGSAREARYSRLPPGEYRFHVTACNEDGVWNETGRVLAVVVLPPFWRTWWFLSLSGALLLGLVSGTVHWVSTQRLRRQVEHLRQQEALERERGRIARDLHDQLGASLTQMALLAELVETDRDSPAEVEAHGRQIAQTARETARALDEIVWTVNPSNDMLEGLVSYLCKYIQDYLGVAGLSCRIEVPPELPALGISPEVRHNVFLAAKEAVTNVVRHARASALWLRLRLEPHRFTIEIEDDGRGPADMDSERARTRSGLNNMRRRLADVGGRCLIEPAPGRGTVVRLTAPLAQGPRRPA